MIESVENDSLLFAKLYTIPLMGITSLIIGSTPILISVYKRYRKAKINTNTRKIALESIIYNDVSNKSSNLRFVH